MSDQISTMLSNLARIRELYGEERFQYAAKHAAKFLLAQSPDLKEPLQKALEGVVDVEALSQEPATRTLPPDDVMVQAIKQAMPGVTSQAHFDIVTSSFEALKTTLNAIFLGDKEKATAGRKALDQAIEGAYKVTDISSKLGHVPEAATSKEAEAFKKPPAQFHEKEVLDSLLLEVSMVPDMAALNEWYKTNRSRIDEVVTQVYRNSLLDGIRAKKREFSS